MKFAKRDNKIIIHENHTSYVYLNFTKDRCEREQHNIRYTICENKKENYQNYAVFIEPVEIFARGKRAQKRQPPSPIWAHKGKTGPHEVKSPQMEKNPTHKEKKT